MSFYTEILMKDARFHSIEQCRDLALLEPSFRAKIERFITLAKTAGHDVAVLETYRSPARQEELYERHLTELREVGVHGFGLAADLKLLINGVYDPRGADYLFFMATAKADDVLSGINWGEPNEAHGFKDYDHLQGIPLWRQPSLFNLSWYPGAGYDAWQDEKEHGINIA